MKINEHRSQFYNELLNRKNVHNYTIVAKVIETAATIDPREGF